MTSQLKTASFRGVKFHVDSADSSFGRSKLVHEFIGSESYQIEDMGRSPARFPIEGYLVGDEYNLVRDLLIKAAEKPGSGKLIHPYLGIKEVECLSFQVRESFDSGSYAKISFEFIESPAKKIGSVFDQMANLVKAADDLMMDVMLTFTEAFSVVGMTAFVAQSAAAMVDKAADFMLSASGLGVFPQGLEDLAGAINAIKSEATELVHTPQILAEKTFTAITHLSRSLVGKSAAIESILRIGRDLAVVTTPTSIVTEARKAEQRNSKAVIDLVRLGSIGIVSRSLPESKTADIRKAVGQITSEIDTVMDETDDRCYRSLHNLRSTLTRSVAYGANLPAAYEITTTIPMPSLVLAYEIYGDLGREAELLAKNNLPNPTWILAGTNLEVSP